ncbi:MAG TPA: hypothetical protein VD789_06595, partial [Thermomicrobiales bacterium]|nr:hypothetical protein [Thermomicrobiales bacterium]
MRSWSAPFLAAGFVMAGLFKAMPVLDRIPIDLTGALAGATVVLIGLRVARDQIPPQVHGVLLAFALLIPAALLGSGSEYATDKILRLFTITLLATLAPILLIRNENDVEKHLWALTAFCAVVTAAGVVNPEPSGEYAGAPISAEGIDTIALGECAGLVLVVVALALMWRRIPWLVGVPVGGAAVYVLLQSGSRGPLVA